MEPIKSSDEELSDALEAAFTLDTLRRFVRFQLNKDLESISTRNNKRAIIFDLIELAKNEGWKHTLIQKAHETVPGNRELSAFVASYPEQMMPPEPRRTEPWSTTPSIQAQRKIPIIFFILVISLAMIIARIIILPPPQPSETTPLPVSRTPPIVTVSATVPVILPWSSTNSITPDDVPASPQTTNIANITPVNPGPWLGDGFAIEILTRDNGSLRIRALRDSDVNNLVLVGTGTTRVTVMDLFDAFTLSTGRLYTNDCITFHNREVVGNSLDPECRIVHSIWLNSAQVFWYANTQQVGIEVYNDDILIGQCSLGVNRCRCHTKEGCHDLQP